MINCRSEFGVLLHKAWSTCLLSLVPYWISLCLSLPPCVAGRKGQYMLDSVSWVSANSIVASGLWYDADRESEGADAYPLAITWSSWEGAEHAAPQGLDAKQLGYFPLSVRI